MAVQCSLWRVVRIEDGFASIHRDAIFPVVPQIGCCVAVTGKTQLRPLRVVDLEVPEAEAGIHLWLSAADRRGCGETVDELLSRMHRKEFDWPPFSGWSLTDVGMQAELDWWLHYKREPLPDHITEQLAKEEAEVQEEIEAWRRALRDGVEG